MKKWVMMCVLALFIAGCSEEQAPKQTKVPVAADEPRIIAGTVVIAEILNELGLNAIAVPETSKKLPGRFAEATPIGNAMQPDMEIIKSLAPTNVLTVTTLQYDLEDIFTKLKIPVQFLNFQSVDNMLQEITMLGKQFAREQEADQLVAKLQKNIDAVQMMASKKEGPRVLVLLGVPGSYLVATEHSYIGDLVKRAGGINVMAGQPQEYLASNTEFLHTSNPDIILRLAHGMPDKVVEMFNEEFASNDIWRHFAAVQNNKVYDLEESLFGTTASLTMPTALGQLMEIFYRQ